MHAFVGDVFQPACHFDVGRYDIDLQACLLQAAGQGHVKRAAQVAVEALDFAFGFCTVRPAQLDDKPAVFGIVKKSAVVPVLAFAMAVTLKHDRLHVVVQHASGYTAKGLEGSLVARHQRLHLHVGDELHVAGAAVTQRGAKGMQRVCSFPELYPVHLQLLAWRGLETHDRIGRRFRFERAQKYEQLGLPTQIAALNNLAHQHRRRYPQRLGRLLTRAQIGLVRCKFGGPHNLANICGHAGVR